MGSTLIGTGVGLGKFFEGKKMQRKGQQLIDSFEFQKLENVQEDRQVSRLGADLATEQANIAAATSTDALRAGGTRGIIGGLGRVQAMQNDVANRAAANLDMQEKEIQGAVAQDNAIIRGMTEQRQANELSGYGQMMNVGMGMKYQGLTDVYNSVSAAEDKALKAAGMAMGMPMGGGGGGGASAPNPVATQTSTLNSTGGYNWGAPPITAPKWGGGGY